MPEQHYDSDQYDDGEFEQLFTAFRDGTPLAVPAGAAAARAVIRRRRQIRAGAAVAALAVLVVAVPALAASWPDGGPPSVPAVTPGPTSSSLPGPGPSVTTPPATPSATATPPDGRISAAELGRATLDLPPWPKWLTVCPAGRVTFRDGKAGLPSEPDAWVRQVDVLHLDLDSDGALETVAYFGCEGMELHEAKVVAFDRDRAGRIVTMGQVIASDDSDIDALSDIRTAGTAVEVRVVDIFSDGIPADLPQRQWRGYSWNGERFVQSSGPTKFPPNPRMTDLAASGGALRMSPDGSDRWTGTLTIDVRNKGPVPATGAFLQVKLPRGFTFPSPPSGCTARTFASGVSVECVLPKLSVGASRRMSLPVAVATSTPPSGSYEAEVGWSAGEGKGRYPEPGGTTADNHVNAEIVASG